MKKSILTFAMAAVLLASCKKADDVTPAATTESATLAVNSNAKHSGTDDAAKKTGADDNQPKHSGTDDAAKKGGTDDNQPKHSGNDEKAISVPAKVTAAFNQKFAGAKVREWKLASNGLYKAHFSGRGANWEASFKADGTFVKVERAL
ncbi:MAG: hypothetical protein EOP47_26725 [Sphingobacteriaceae bacterium]|nr:MAG: hypothetical protein EOP47_26725 [Sphingobacteriaceae bacterium]